MDRSVLHVTITVRFFFLLYVGYFSPSLLWVILLHFSHKQADWSSPSFSSTTFQNFFGICDLLNTESKFQQNKNLCSRCSILFVSSSNLSWIRWWEEFSAICWKLLWDGNAGFNFFYAPWIMCYQATQIVEIFHIFRSLLIYHSLY
jgi:hypothetical protein